MQPEDYKWAANANQNDSDTKIVSPLLQILHIYANILFIEMTDNLIQGLLWDVPFNMTINYIAQREPERERK